MKKNTIRIMISSIIGLVLGIITELALIYYWKNTAVITQDLGFWFLIYLIGILFSKNIKQAIFTNSLIMTSMNLGYYGTRLICGKNFYIDAVILFFVFGILGSITISVLFKLPQKTKYISAIAYVLCIIFFIKYYIIERLERRTAVTSYVKTFNYNTYIILAIAVIAISIISIIRTLKKETIIKED